jgi:hypothetical protein
MASSRQVFNSLAIHRGPPAELHRVSCGRGIVGRFDGQLGGRRAGGNRTSLDGYRFREPCPLQVNRAIESAESPGSQIDCVRAPLNDIDAISRQGQFEIGT